MPVVAVPQAADSFPSHLLPLLAALLAAVALAVGWRAGAGPWRLARWWWRARRLGGSRGALLAAGLAAALVGASFVALGPPIPRVSDELSYLLSADTFLHGRLTNPPPPAGGHFTGDNVLDEPTRSSRYPPAQGLLLAAGRRLTGGPWGGLILSAAALAAGTVWMLRPWVAAPWPLMGGLLVALGPAFGSYWSQSYWGGHVSAVGSLLLVGAVGRLRRRAGLVSALALGTGLGLLAASRPWEGLAAGLGVALWLGLHVARGPREGRASFALRLAPPALLALAPWLVLLAAHDRAVTGDPWTMPHTVYLATRGGLPELRFQEPSAEQIARAGALEVDRRWFDPAAAAGRTGRLIYHQAGLPLAAAALGGFACMLRRRRVRSASSAWRAWALPVLGLLAVAAAHGLTRSYFPHYSSPAFGFVWMLAIAGARHLGTGARAGATLALTLAAGQLLYSLAELPAHRPDRDDWSRERLRIERELRQAGGEHLVFVAAPGDWVHNGADLAGSPVLWANALGPERDAPLLTAFPGRTVWRVSGVDSSGPFHPEAYLASAAQPAAPVSARPAPADW